MCRIFGLVYRIEARPIRSVTFTKGEDNLHRLLYCHEGLAQSRPGTKSTVSLLITDY